MTHTHFQNFAVVGAGGVGTMIANALHATGKDIKIKVLTRKASSNSTASLPKEVEVVKVDYSSLSELEKALEGCDIVFSTLAGEGLAVQPNVAKAAKNAQIKHFVPSEYGTDTSKLTSGPLVVKTQLQHYLKELGLPFTAIYNGAFTDLLFTYPLLGFDLQNKTAHIVEPGTAPISTTTRIDVARFVAHYFTSITPSNAAQTLRLEGDRQSPLEMVKIYEKVHGRTSTLDVTMIPQSQLQDLLDKDGNDFLAYLKMEWAQGRGIVGTDEGLDIWPRWNPMTVQDVLQKMKEGK